MKGSWRSSFLLALGVATVASCALLTPATVETRKEMLTKIPVDFPEGKTHPAILLVFAPETSTVYDTTQMAYAARPYQIAYFSRTEWGERPPQMIHPLLVQTLQKAGYFSAVVTPPFMGHYTHALRTEILALQQDFTAEPATLRLTLSCRVRSCQNGLSALGLEWAGRSIFRNVSSLRTKWCRSAAPAWTIIRGINA